MKISEAIVQEAVRTMEESGPVVAPLIIGFKKIRDENPHLAEFINAALDTWQENPPSTLDDQLSTLFVNLVLLADIFRRQEEVTKIEKDLG